MVEKISCIPCDEKKYLSFSKEVVFDKFANSEGKEIIAKLELRFIDSLRFMPSSLNALSKNLSKDQCKNLCDFFKDQQKLDLLLINVVYSYDYVNYIDRLNETRLQIQIQIQIKFVTRARSHRNVNLRRG